MIASVVRGRNGIGASASRSACILTLALLLAACAAPSSRQSAGAKRPPPTAEPFRIQDLAKSDIDNVTETHLEESLAIVRNIAEKLYRRNPREWRKGPYKSPEVAVDRVFDRSQAWRFAELNNVRGTDAIYLAFRAEFAGDRVFAFTVGLGSMIYDAYGGKDEFYIFDVVEPQSGLQRRAERRDRGLEALERARRERAAPAAFERAVGPPAERQLRARVRQADRAPGRARAHPRAAREPHAAADRAAAADGGVPAGEVT